MQLDKLLTYSFDKNVGMTDRVLRVLNGAAIAALPWLINLPPTARYGAVIVGVMMIITGIVSRCGLYYMLGFSTCPISGKSKPVLNRH